MQAIQHKAQPSAPVAAVVIARRLGEPMSLVRQQVLSINTRRYWQVWEFQSLADSQLRKLIAVDVCDRQIKRWKLCEHGFGTVVADCQHRIVRQRTA